MAIPLSYNFRNLMVRKTTTVMTSAGIMLSVAVLVASLALVNGLRTVFANTGHPLQILVLRNGGTSELGSLIPTESFEILRSKAGVAIDGRGEALVSPELVNVANLPSVDNPKGMNITVRGINPVGIEMRSVRLTDGRWFRSGQREIVIGKSVARRYPTAKLGSRIRFGKGDWEIVGITDGGESALNSEIWGDFNQIASDYNRQDSASSVLVRATDPVTLDALKHSIEDDRRLNANAIPERDYYASQTASGAPLRTLGFSEASILLSFLTESVLIAVLAGALGCALVLPLNWVTSGIGSFVSFSEIAFRFRVDPKTIASGVIFSVVLGVLGGVLPARAAAKKEIIAALREG